MILGPCDFLSLYCRKRSSQLTLHRVDAFNISQPKLDNQIDLSLGMTFCRADYTVGVTNVINVD